MTTHAPPHRRPRLSAALIAVVALASALLVPLAPAAAAPVPVPDVPRAGISFNGPVYSIVMGDGVAYAGGSSTSVTGTNGTFSRSRLAAVDLATGAVTAFRADADATVRALALAAGSLFVGGDFTRVHGSARGRLAEVDSTTGALRALHRDPNARVRALAVRRRSALRGRRLHAGRRSRPIACCGAADLQPVAGSAFAPVLNGAVHSLATTPTGAVVLAGGWFTSVNGSSTRRYLASFTPAGAVRDPVFALAHNNPVLGVDTDDAGTRVFAAVGGDVSGNQVASYATWRRGRSAGSITPTATCRRWRTTTGTSTSGSTKGSPATPRCGCSPPTRSRARSSAPSVPWSTRSRGVGARRDHARRDRRR